MRRRKVQCSNKIDSTDLIGFSRLNFFPLIIQAGQHQTHFSGKNEHTPK
jgi:hypothetical protein